MSLKTSLSQNHRRAIPGCHQSLAGGAVFAALLPRLFEAGGSVLLPRFLLRQVPPQYSELGETLKLKTLNLKRKRKPLEEEEEASSSFAWASGRPDYQLSCAWFLFLGTFVVLH